MSYVLRANTSDGVYYYMNILCVTQQEENAKHYANEEEARKDAEHFKNMFHYEQITPEIIGATGAHHTRASEFMKAGMHK